MQKTFTATWQESSISGAAAISVEWNHNNNIVQTGDVPVTDTSSSITIDVNHADFVVVTVKFTTSYNTVSSASKRIDVDLGPPKTPVIELTVS